MYALVVMLIRDFPLGVTSHGNIMIRFLPNKWDVVNFSKFGCWDNTRLHNHVLRDHPIIRQVIIPFCGINYLSPS